MASFRKKEKASPGISTASLPDIVFMLLFFFMVSTVMRETDLLVETTLPKASQLQKLQDKSLISYIYVGPPTGKKGLQPKIQVNDVFIDHTEIPQFIVEQRAELPENKKDKIIISLKVNNTTKMGLVTDLKQQLREANALKINYASTQDDGE